MNLTVQPPKLPRKERRIIGKDVVTPKVYNGKLISPKYQPCNYNESQMLDNFSMSLPSVVGFS